MEQAALYKKQEKAEYKTKKPETKEIDFMEELRQLDSDLVVKITKIYKY